MVVPSLSSLAMTCQSKLISPAHHRGLTDPSPLDRLIPPDPPDRSRYCTDSSLLLMCFFRRWGITALSTPSPLSFSPDPPSKQLPPTGSDEFLFAEQSACYGTENQILQPPPSTPVAPPEFPSPEPTLLRPSSAEIADGSFLPSLPCRNTSNASSRMVYFATSLLIWKNKKSAPTSLLI
ncbi:unnamed protein product [Arabis nemorensis]|uniref:Uncharacterized protein n=1 Tax=Arabis nemorensis TaxID=586526 RepID=A0A565CRD4_9BRAS|nr:unnamed protein product [Arabis nemorensis]